MSINSELMFFLLAITIAGVIIFFVMTKKSNSLRLFLKALRSENNREFLDAIKAYENALSEVEKSKFEYTLKTKIKERIKVLRTIVEYENSRRFQVK
jgi:hypothetical protein